MNIIYLFCYLLCIIYCFNLKDILITQFLFIIYNSFLHKLSCPIIISKILFLQKNNFCINFFILFFLYSNNKDLI